MIRVVEAADLDAVHALLTAPATARWAGRTPYDGLPMTAAFLADAGVHRIGRFEGEELVACATIARNPRDRLLHTAMLALYYRDDPHAVLDAAIDTADRWLGVAKLEVEIDASDPILGILEGRGFVVEARKIRGRRGGGSLVDGLLLGRLRPGWVPDGPPRPPPAHRGRGERVAVQIRHVRDDDLTEWTALHRTESVVWGTFQLPFGSSAVWSARIRSNDRHGRHALVAWHGDRMAGAGGLHRHPFPSDHSAVLGMCVHPDFQGCGVGEQILDALVDLSERWLGLDRLELEVYADNRRAIGLYEKLGFVREGVRRVNGYRDGAHCDALVMARLRSLRVG